MSTKLHTKSYSNNDRLFFLLNPNEYIAENDPVRIVDAVVESLDLKEFRKLYRERGPLSIPSEDDAQDYPVRLHEQHLLMPAR